MYYIHGDKQLDSDTLYYCRHCDLFVHAAEHFASFDLGHSIDLYVNGKHALSAQQKAERIGMKNWFETNRRYLNINYKSKTKRVGFKKWLNRFTEEDSLVGDFASDVLRDDHFPHSYADKETCRAYLDNASFFVGNNVQIMELFELLWNDYESKKTEIHSTVFKV